MIKALGELNDGTGQILILGLEEGNITRLRQGKPILVKLSEMADRGMKWQGEILILLGEDQGDVICQLNETGALCGVPVHTYKETQ